MLQQPVAGLRTVSPDGKWLVARVQTAVDSQQMAFPLGHGAPIRINAGSFWFWKSSPDRKWLSVSVPEPTMAVTSGRFYFIPVRPGRARPVIPDGGFGRDEDLAKVAGVRVMEVLDVAPGPSGNVYAFSRASVQRNLYRMPLE